MKKILFSILAIVMSVAVYSDTIPEGDIFGTWTLSGSPYLITGTTTVPDGNTLTIEAGVTVEWQGSYTMFVDGRILAQGTEADSITFTAADTATGWRSIRFDSTSSANDTSRFEFCVFRYGKVYGDWPDNCGGALAGISVNKFVVDHCLFDQNEATDATLYPNPAGGAIALSNSSPVIRNCRFTNNVSLAGGAIGCGYVCNPIIANNEFTGNTALDPSGHVVWGQGCGGALSLYKDSHPRVSHNIFRDNFAERHGGAIVCNDNCNPQIDHNLIYNNTAANFLGGGIELEESCSPVLINNTIAYNQADFGGGIDMMYNCHPEIRNSIFWNNSAIYGGTQVNLYDPTCVPNFYYCDIEGGQTVFGGYPFTGAYENCMDLDPVFEDPSSGLYGLMMYDSPCIDAGDPDPMYNDPDGSRNDMGALWPPVPPIGVPEPAGMSCIDLSVYPNPADGIVDCQFGFVDCRFVTLKVYDLCGREARTHVAKMKTGVECSLRLDVSDLPAEVYLIRVQVGSESVIRKIVKL